jgi:hypothetical protein
MYIQSVLLWDRRAIVGKSTGVSFRPIRDCKWFDVQSKARVSVHADVRRRNATGCKRNKPRLQAFIFGPLTRAPRHAYGKYTPQSLVHSLRHVPKLRGCDNGARGSISESGSASRGPAAIESMFVIQNSSIVVDWVYRQGGCDFPTCVRLGRVLHQGHRALRW